jgi:CubicO group peptidase (beta-lactamase class C family)
MIKAIAIIMSCSSLMFGCATAPVKPAKAVLGDYTYLKQYVSWLVKKEMKKQGVTGLSIALVDDQQIVWAEGFGYADAPQKIRATPETVYRIGSISKVITALEVMKLAETGRIDIDKPLTDYIPAFSMRSRLDKTEPITLRSLLAHHSGLPSDRLQGMWVDRPESLAQLVEDLKEEYLAGPPQTMYKYSNLDFSLLGRVVETAETGDFSSIMQRELLQPLGMTHSSFDLTPEIEKHYARGYRKGSEAPQLNLRDKPAGSMLSTVTDMGRFMKFIFAEGKIRDKQLMKQETIAELFRPQFTGRELDFGHTMGLSWMLSGLTVYGVDKVAWHNGGYPPYEAHLSLLPDKKLGIVVLANTAEASTFITQMGVKALELMLEAKEGIKQPVSPTPAKEKPVKVSGEVLKNYAGNYVVFGALSPITQDGSRLRINALGTTLDLTPIKNDTFIIQKTILGLLTITIPNYSLQFTTVEGNDVALLRGLPAPFAFEKVPPYTIPDTWMRRLGEYTLDAPDEYFKLQQIAIQAEGGILFAQIKMTDKSTLQKALEMKIALKPVSDTEAIVVGLGNGEGGTLRVVHDGGVEKLIYSGFHFIPVDGHK